MKDWTKSDKKFRYMLLDRERQDCEYYIRIGATNPSILCCGDVKTQIEEMKALWNSFSDEDKPEWLSMDDILEFERKMLLRK